MQSEQHIPEGAAEGRYARIVLLPDLHLTDAAFQRLAALSAFPVRRIRDEELSSSEGVLDPEADALVCAWKSELNAALLARFPRLRVIALRATSTRKVDLDYVHARGIEVKNIHGYGDIGTTEFVIEQLLDMVRQSRIHDRQLPTELAGKRLGLLGFGNVAVMVAAAANALGMDVRYHVPDPARRQRPGTATWLPLEALLETSDFLSIHTPPFQEVLDGEALARIPGRAGVIVTTLGLPFPVEAFRAWSRARGNPVVFDMCAAHAHLDALAELPGVRVAELFSARTVESVGRAEQMVIDNLIAAA